MSDDAVLVLGATGLVGAHVVQELSAAGVDVVAVSRRPAQAAGRGVRWVQADVTRPEDLATIPVCPRAVSTLAIWMTAEMAPTLAERGLRRLVAFSSTSAVTKADAADDGERQLARMLLAGERGVQALAPRVQSTILRPTMIYGGPGDANVERIAGQLRRFSWFPLVDGGRGLRQPVHAADLAAAAVRALDTPVTRGRVYAVAGGEVLDVREMIARIARANGKHARFVRVPIRPAEHVLRLLSRLPRFRRVPAGALRRMSHDLVFDNSAAMTDFGYAPRAFHPPDYRSTD